METAKQRYNKSEKGRLRTRTYTNRKRQELWAKISAMKEGEKCADCGGHFPPVCMDYDHKGNEKTASVTALAAQRASWERILKEIEQCELVCANCHRLRSQAERKRKYDEARNLNALPDFDRSAAAREWAENRQRDIDGRFI